MNRRYFLLAAGCAAGMGALATGTVKAESASPKRVLRLAHLTDFHIQPESRGGEGVAACLQQIQSLPDKPDLILSGGDHIMDSFRKGSDRTRQQWELWQKVSAAESNIPIRSCLGNHDIWGWDHVKSSTTGAEAKYGKKWACEVLGLERTYYSFSQAGWHFIALDGIQESTTPARFTGCLDEDQYGWLEQELQSVPSATPILIWTHIPIVSALALLIAERETPHGNSLLDAGHVHTDANRLLALLAKYPNVRVCLAGHLHRVEQIDYRGLRHYCTGAVCGKWWKGPNDGFPEGYSIVDLYDDGTHHWEYVPSGWQA